MKIIEKYEDMDYLPKDINEMHEFFWYWYPNEISWKELKEINIDLYCRLQNMGLALILSGKIKSINLKE